MASTSNHIISQDRARSRRKLRKGTFSCWECKRRKIKCEIPSLPGIACASCRRLGAQCISQEVDEPSRDVCEQSEKRLVQIESLVDQLIQRRVNEPSKAHAPGVVSGTDEMEKVSKKIRFQVSAGARAANSPAQRNNGPPSLHQTNLIEDMSTRCVSLCAYLHPVLPASSTQAMIIAHGKSPFSPHERHVITQARYAPTAGHGASIQKALSIARHLAQLALCLERLNSNPNRISNLSLEDSHAKLARRLVDATYSVTCFDGLIDSLEGVELLMLQSSFETIVGNTKSALLLIRRALTIIQLLDCNQDFLQHTERVKAMWIKLVHFDCILSLMLGKTSFSESCIFLTNLAPVNESLILQLEKVHTIAASRIIERNSRMQRRLLGTGSIFDSYNDYEDTQSIDRDLKQAMHTLPIHYWHQTAMPINAIDAQKTIDQLHHFDLLVLVHLPYLITGPHREQSNNENDLPTHDTANEYSKLAAACASREVLSRVLMCCNNRNIPCSLNGLWHKAFIASVCLLLAHINGHRLGDGNVLAYQRASDLRKVYELIDHVEDSSSPTGEIPAKCSTETLRRLLEIEEQAASGNSYCVVSGAGLGQRGHDAYDIVDTDFQFPLPYLGMIAARRLYSDWTG